MNKPTLTLKRPPKKAKLFTVRRSSLLLLVAGASGLLLSCSYAPHMFTPSKRAAVFSASQSTKKAQQPLAQQAITLSKAETLVLTHHLQNRMLLQVQAISKTPLDLSGFNLPARITPRTTVQEEGLEEEQGEGSDQESLPSTSPSATSPSTTSPSTTIQEEPEPSTTVAQEQGPAAENLSKNWDLLDFGIHVLQARQATNANLVAVENQRRASYTLLQELRSAFWQAAGAQQLVETISPVIQQARAALTKARKGEKKGLIAQLATIRAQKSLMETIEYLQELRQQLNQAKIQFATLMQLPANTPFKLEIPTNPAETRFNHDLTLEEMERLALYNRIELHDPLLTEPIPGDMIKNIMLSILPGLNFNLSSDLESNPLSQYAPWQEASTQIIWTLFDQLQPPLQLSSNDEATEHEATEEAEAWLEPPHWTAPLAVLSQVHLAFRHYLNAIQILQVAEKIDAVERKSLRILSNKPRQNTQSHLEYISSAVSAITARLQLYQAYANAQNSVSRLEFTLGPAPFPALEAIDSASTVEAGSEQTSDTPQEATQGVTTGPDITPTQRPINTQKPAAVETNPNATNAATHATKRSAVAGHTTPLKRGTTPASATPASATPASVTTPSLPPSSPVQEQGQKPATTPTQSDHATTAEAATTKTTTPQATHTDHIVAIDDSEVEKNVATTTTWQPPPGEINDTIIAKPSIEEEIENFLRRWTEAWSRRDIEAYFAFYSTQQFTPPYGQSIETWRQRTRKTLGSLTFLQIDIDQLEIVREVFPLNQQGSTQAEASQEFIRVSLRESYRSNQVQGLTKKLLVLGKEAGDWKIFREAASEISPTDLQPSQDVHTRYAIQIASMSVLENANKIRSEWLQKGIQTTMVETVDAKNTPRYSIRIAHFNNKDRALIFKWLLQLMTGMDSMLIPLNDDETEKQLTTTEPKMDNNNDTIPNMLNHDQNIPLPPQPLNSETQPTAPVPSVDHPDHEAQPTEPAPSVDHPDHEVQPTEPAPSVDHPDHEAQPEVPAQSVNHADHVDQESINPEMPAQPVNQEAQPKHSEATATSNGENSTQGDNP